MRGPATLFFAAAMIAATPALASEVEVTRFHTEESLASLVPGPIAVRMAEGDHDQSLEARLWIDAVAASLAAAGFEPREDAATVAEIRLDQELVRRARRGGSGVQVGVGAGTGGWRGGGTHLGVGLGLLLGGGKSRERLASELSVTILEAGSRRHLWEGRAVAAPRARSDDADPARLAGEMADALFTDFPGRPGETIGVR